MNLMEASNQYFKRPADERYPSTLAVHAAVKGLLDASIESKVDPKELLVGYTNSENSQLVVQGPAGVPARLTHRAQQQLLSMALPKAGAIVDLVPVELAAQCIQAGLEKRSEDEKSNKLLLYKPKDEEAMTVCRAFTGPDYSRIWHADVTGRMLALEQQDPRWKAPLARGMGHPTDRPCTKEDIIDYGSENGLSVNVGDIIDPCAGTYFGQGIPELFLFRVHADPNHTIQGATQARQLNRFLMISNSETGDASFRIRGGLFDSVCGNHIIWGAHDIWEAKIRHVGRAAERADEEMQVRIEQYANGDTQEDELKVKKATTFLLGQSKEEVLNRLFGLKIATRKVLEASWEAADQKVLSYGSPTTAWGFASGMQEVSQQAEFADARVRIDEAASKVLQMAF